MALPIMPKESVIVAPHHRAMGDIFSEEDRARLDSLCEVVWGQDGPMPQDQFEAALPDAVAVVFGSWPYGAGVLEKAPRLRAALEVSGGHWHPDFDYETCFQRGIRLGSCAPAFAPQVAEMALGMVLASSRTICSGDRAFRAGEEKYSKAGNVGAFMLYGKTVGLVGYGSLARALQPLLAPFGVRLLAYDPWLPDSLLHRGGVEPASLETIFSEARVIFLLAAPTSENQALITRELMERLGPDRVLAVISRAHLVDFDALTELVLAGRFRAAIDVFPTEPLPADHPIRQAEHAVLSAHRCGWVAEGMHEIGRMVVDDLEMILRGLPPQRMQPAHPELVRKLRSR